MHSQLATGQWPLQNLHTYLAYIGARYIWVSYQTTDLCYYVCTCACDREIHAACGFHVPWH